MDPEIQKLTGEVPGHETPIVIHWFRRDLRLEDNTSLCQALKSGYKVLPVFIFDKNILDKLPGDNKRVSFIYQALVKLNSDLRNHNSCLSVFYGYPEEVFRELMLKLPVKGIYLNRDYESYAVTRDDAIKRYCTGKGIDFFSFKDQVIFEGNEVLKDNGQPYTVFTPFSKKWLLKLNDKPGALDRQVQSEENYLHRPFKDIPSLKEIGFEEIKNVFSLPVIKEDIITNYHRTRDFPYLQGTSRLSAHLRFGTVSIRHLVEAAKKLNPTWLNELIWREFFFQILWNYPDVENRSFRSKFDTIPWNNNEDDFHRWCAGQTGYPIVDAGMRELHTTGFMHNRVRMITASFLVKHLLIDWRWGEQWFAQQLLDYELAVNNGNWQWAAGCGCDAAPFFRIFNPTIQAKKFDPENRYIQKWVPEYGTESYTNPIVEHQYARTRCLDAYYSLR